MDEQLQITINEIRYAERLCARTARMYRRLQTVGTWFAVFSGGTVFMAVSKNLPEPALQVGLLLLAALAAMLVAVRPADKAAANELDARRYARLRTEVTTMTAADARAALAKARESDAPEVETLRDVAYNDLMLEIGRSDLAVPLTLNQRVLSALA